MKNLFKILTISFCLFSNITKSQNISAGWNHNVIIKTDGSLWSWGDNTYGQLGIGSTLDQNLPVRIGTELNWVSVSCGGGHSLAIKSDGSLWAWGNNASGQLGIGSTTSKYLPIQVGIAKDWKMVSAGGSYNLAIKNDGTLWAWGSNTYGELGIGSSINSKNQPVQVTTLNDCNFISAGNSFSMVIKSDGSLWAFGINSNGQLGINSTVNKISPVRIGLETSWTKVSAGNAHCIALKSDGSLWSWGNNTYGQLGDGTFINKTIPTQLGTDTNWSSINVGYKHSFAIKNDGTIWSWGDNNYGKLGLGDAFNYKNTPLKVGLSTDWTFVGGGYEHTIAIKSDGSVWLWGDNHSSQIGIGSNSFQTSPRQVNNSYNYFWKSISGGSQHTLAIKDDGSLWAWGDNTYGQLGNGTLTQTNTPLRIGSDTDWKIVKAGLGHSLAIKNDGTLWAWGWNYRGELGISNNTDQSSPVKVGTNLWDDISASGTSSYGIKTDGTLWAWGYGGSGLIGDGTTSNQNAPKKIVLNNINWIFVSTSGKHVIALQNTGYLMSWGYNYYGQLGKGTKSGTYYNPTQTGSDFNWTSGTTGSDHSLMLKNDGTLWAFGYNISGQLGNNSTSENLTPIQVGTESNWSKVVAGNTFSLALKTDGTIRSWGDNHFGQLGDGTIDNKIIPTQIGNSSNWINISAGYNHALGIKSDGTLWSWGDNTYGQLGFESNYYKTPQIIVSQDNTLPVKLIDFECSNQHNRVILKWSTLSEQSNSHYLLSHSINGSNFIILAKVPGSINGSVKNTYSYMHLNPIYGNNYYKLEQVDINGNVSDLGTRVTKLSLESEKMILVYPNPTQNELKISFGSNIYHTAKLIDLQGKILLNKIISINDSEIIFEMKALEIGNYVILLEGKSTYTQMIEKSN